MINEKKHAELRMLILIAPPKLARRAAELFDRGQVPFQYQFHGQGTVSGELLETLGLGSIEKSILMVCLPRCMAAQLLKKLRRELRLGDANTGVAFTVPMTGGSGRFIRLLEALEPEHKKLVEDCVNHVGVDLNTASFSLLSHIAGINQTIAKNIVTYRTENGAFTDRKQLKKVAKLNIQTICPLHGPVLTGDLAPYLHLYQTWSSYTPEEKGVLVAHASIHGNTAKAAAYLAEQLKALGEKVTVIDLCRCDMAEAVAQAFRYDRMVLAASSYDGGVFLPMEEFLLHLQYKAFQNRTVALVENGSWAPCAAKNMRAVLDTMKQITVLEPTVTIRSAVKPEDEEHLRALAEAVRQGA